jgi:hypothetical protein
VPALMENLPGPLHLIPDPTDPDAQQQAVSGQLFGQAGPIGGIVEPVMLDSRHLYE